MVMTIVLPTEPLVAFGGLAFSWLPMSYILSGSGDNLFKGWYTLWVVVVGYW